MCGARSRGDVARHFSNALELPIRRLGQHCDHQVLQCDDAYAKLDQLGVCQLRNGRLGFSGNQGLFRGARRCAALLESDALRTELSACRSALDRASLEAMPEQRARASELALRAATTLVVSGGGRAIALDHQAQRLAREALFLLVFGQTATIKAAQLRRIYDESHG